jgi:hypothetical protein
MVKLFLVVNVVVFGIVSANQETRASDFCPTPTCICAFYSFRIQCILCIKIVATKYIFVQAKWPNFF